MISGDPQFPGKTRDKVFSLYLWVITYYSKSYSRYIYFYKILEQINIPGVG